MWKSTVGQSTPPSQPQQQDDDDWDTDPDFVNNVSEKDQRWGMQKTIDPVNPRGKGEVVDMA
ncbi:hypothetical protein HK104_006386, partial [Borealophlyctis nickersoniae]